MAARAQWTDLSGDAPVLAKDHAAVDSARRRGHLESATGGESKLARVPALHLIEIITQ
ncbi:hypothetical protein BN874_750025 [Candidatus Contendobacter odensis Run_B_J11]|uniref:Uncharacterized protein n=1 Tax=Candidatus Contendobacter odensis Run_B_J11 TaxID=1400861 RepID=A0A7U7GFX5_9GAMM|nr:hypothetical protein BN874_750025 [Candidatus Contendobacter odensis Run_B_J11]